MPQGPGSGPQRQAPRVHYLLSYCAGAGDSTSGLHKIWAVKPGKIYKNGALRREGAAPPLARPEGRKLCNCPPGGPPGRRGSFAGPPFCLNMQRPARGRFGPGRGISVLHGAPAGGAGNRKPKGRPLAHLPGGHRKCGPKRHPSPKNSGGRPKGQPPWKTKLFCTRGKTKAGAFLGCGLNLSGADARQSRRTPVQNRWQ